MLIRDDRGGVLRAHRQRRTGAHGPVEGVGHSRLGSAEDADRAAVLSRLRPLLSEIYRGVFAHRYAPLGPLAQDGAVVLILRVDRRLMTELVLTLPDFQRLFEVHTDVSDRAIRMVPVQEEHVTYES